MKSKSSSSLWVQPPSPAMIVVPTSGEIRGGTLIMRSVTAQQAIRRIAGFQYECGRIAKAYVPVGSSTGISQFGFAPVRLPTDETCGIGIFQVNWFDREPRCTELIALSSHRLKRFSAETNYNIRIALYDDVMRSILTGENLAFVPPKF